MPDDQNGVNEINSRLLLCEVLLEEQISLGVLDESAERLVERIRSIKKKIENDLNTTLDKKDEKLTKLDQIMVKSIYKLQRRTQLDRTKARLKVVKDELENLAVFIADKEEQKHIVEDAVRSYIYGEGLTRTVNIQDADKRKVERARIAFGKKLTKRLQTKLPDLNEAQPALTCLMLAAEIITTNGHSNAVNPTNINTDGEQFGYGEYKKILSEITENKEESAQTKPELQKENIIEPSIKLKLKDERVRDAVIGLCLTKEKGNNREADRGKILSDVINSHLPEYEELLSSIGIVDDEMRKALTERCLREAGNANGNGTGKDAKGILHEIINRILNSRNLKDGMRNNRAVNNGDVSFKELTGVEAATSPSALCLSGGGIRSATFNLGILQGLARHGLLDKFDYLSTVSGGGFIGGWLSAWIQREGINKVMPQLGHCSKDPLKPEAQQIKHLRAYSRFLSPRPGLLSGDTWTLIATVFRNLMMNWIVFLPVFTAILMLPRIWFALINRNSLSVDPNIGRPIVLFGGWLMFMFSLIMIGIYLPSTHERFDTKNGKGSFMACLLPLLLAAMALSTIWFRMPLGWHTVNGQEICEPSTGIFLDFRCHFNLKEFVFFSVSAMAVPWLIASVLRWQNAKDEQRKGIVRGIIFPTFLVIAAQAITGAIFFGVANQARVTTLYNTAGNNVNDLLPQLLYTSFGVPVAMLLAALGLTLLSGLTSRFTEDDDQEWWARASGMILITCLVWSAGSVLVLWGPIAIFWMMTTDLSQWHKWGTFAFGILSGIITIFGGLSAQSPATAEEAKRTGPVGKLITLLTTVLAPLFMIFLIMLVTTATNGLIRLTHNLLVRVKETTGSTLWGLYEKDFIPTPLDQYATLQHTPLRYLLLLFFLLLLFGLLAGRLINTNRFSLHALWRNRIVLAYLGASRKRRSPNFFTGFDTFDNLYMKEMRKQRDEFEEEITNPWRPENPEKKPPMYEGKLLHVLNIALNLSNPTRLELQDRKSTSFTVSPLHCGSYLMGYRRTSQYGHDDGISLGTAISVSGAFVSPNMGYMTLSPIVRFLMTLFNVRFGWWLGNPGRYGEKQSKGEAILEKVEGLFTKHVAPFQKSAPRLSILPIVNEALGNANDKSTYVYLSDGGHFENFGLYEMVLRRNRFIVVSDGTTDPAYDFQSLAQSIRQIRVDLGVPIELEDFNITSQCQDFKGKYCAVGKIRYSRIDNPTPGVNDEDYDGVLIYIKATMIGGEPRDIVNYQKGSKDFPNETIVDQWFSESQFESYRALGSHIIDVICKSGESSFLEGDRTQVNFSGFAYKASHHNQINYRVFQENVNYAVYQEQVVESIKENDVEPLLENFKRKVKGEIKRLFK